MRPFSYQRLLHPHDVTTLHNVSSRDAYIAGGTTLLDLMKLDVMRPERVIDLDALSPSPDFGGIEVADSGLYLGALVRMADAADHEHIRANYPVVSQTLNLAASQQIRNMASLGGNVLQRTRCPYFRDTSWNACNKRTPGSGCAAIGGFNRMHAVLGTSDNCIATYPGDFAQALVALDADVFIIGPQGNRTIKFAQLHTQPADEPEIETTLGPGELIGGFRIPAGPWTRRSAYVKVRDRESYEFAMASAAVALHLDGDVVNEARIALGGVATVPWRAREAETRLAGKHLDEAVALDAAEAAFADARPYEHNGFKVQLGKATLVRSLLQVKVMEI
jgi:xanthine dehydrogenase YagS FAD-binding subunit